MKVLVTGGTGFIGGHLVEALVGKGHQVRCLVRKTSNVDHLRKLGVEPVFGDILDVDSLEKAASGVDLVYHLAGLLGRLGVPVRSYWDIHVTGTQNILQASQTRNAGRFIYCSSAGVLGPITNPPADETWPYAPSNSYEEAKVAAEKLVLDSLRNSRLAVTVIRPEFVYGPRCRHLLPFFKSVKQGWFVIVGKGQAFIHPTFISDLVDGLMLAGEKGPQSTGKVYLIVGERYVTVNELVAVMRRYMRKGEASMHIPYSLGWAGAVLCEALAGVFRVSPPLTKSRVKFFNEHRAFTWEKAAQELGYRPSVSLEEGIAKTIQWYNENGWV